MTNGSRMRIGLTYDLRSEYLALGYSEDETAEFDRDETIEAIEASLRRLGHDTERIGHVHRLVERLAQGSRWELVFNIAEGIHGIGGRHRCRPSWMPTISPTPSRTRWS